MSQWLRYPTKRVVGLDPIKAINSELPQPAFYSRRIRADCFETVQYAIVPASPASPAIADQMGLCGANQVPARGEPADLPGPSIQSVVFRETPKASSSI